MGGKYCSNCATEKLPRFCVAYIASICNLLHPCVNGSQPSDLGLPLCPAKT